MRVKGINYYDYYYFNGACAIKISFVKQNQVSTIAIFIIHINTGFLWFLVRLHFKYLHEQLNVTYRFWYNYYVIKWLRCTAKWTPNWVLDFHFYFKTLVLSFTKLPLFFNVDKVTFSNLRVINSSVLAALISRTIIPYLWLFTSSRSIPMN